MPAKTQTAAAPHAATLPEKPHRAAHAQPSDRSAPLRAMALAGKMHVGGDRAEPAECGGDPGPLDPRSPTPSRPPRTTASGGHLGALRSRDFPHALIFGGPKRRAITPNPFRGRREPADFSRCTRAPKVDLHPHGRMGRSRLVTAGHPTLPLRAGGFARPTVPHSAWAEIGACPRSAIHR